MTISCVQSNYYKAQCFYKDSMTSEILLRRSVIQEIMGGRRPLREQTLVTFDHHFTKIAHSDISNDFTKLGVRVQNFHDMEDAASVFACLDGAFTPYQTKELGNEPLWRVFSMHSDSKDKRILEFSVLFASCSCYLYLFVAASINHTKNAAAKFGLKSTACFLCFRSETYSRHCFAKWSCGFASLGILNACNQTCANHTQE